MTFESILYTKEDGVAKITLNRPEALNALVMEMREELAAALVDARDDQEIRAIVVTGAGRAFCAGGDLKAMAKGFTAIAGRARVHRADRLILTEIMNIEKPVIAMVNGLAVGAGCNIALACDIVIASEEAKFAEIFTRIGLIPDLGGLFVLPRLVGMHKAKELIFTGDSIDAAEAVRIGMINKAVPAAELESTVMELAQRLAKGPTRAIGISKALMHRALATDLAGAIELEALGQGICMQTDDHKEGVSAFFEKRTAQFKGQ